MKIGMIGLGRMGFNLVRHLMESGHEAVVYDVEPDSVQRLGEFGAQPASSIGDLVARLESPRIIWLMVPAGGVVDAVLGTMKPLLGRGDIVIDGGNSHYKESMQRAAGLEEAGIFYFDAGTSGGMEGARQGGCFMIGGNREVFPQIEPLFQSLAVENGYLFSGPSGSGHFLKMVHNGIEYGMMQSIAEGFELLHKSGFELDYEAVARVWSNGSVIRGWLMELTERAFAKDPKLDGIQGVMKSSGEGKWTVEAALELETSLPVIAMSLFMRYRSMDTDTFHGKVVAALRNEFGGHEVVRTP